MLSPRSPSVDLVKIVPHIPNRFIFTMGIFVLPCFVATTFTKILNYFIFDQVQKKILAN
jgi:hypothetical protein